MEYIDIIFVHAAYTNVYINKFCIRSLYTRTIVANHVSRYCLVMMIHICGGMQLPIQAIIYSEMFDMNIDNPSIILGAIFHKSIHTSSKNRYLLW